MPACSAQRSNSQIMEIFQTLGSGSLSVTDMLDFYGKANTSIHGLEGATRQLHRLGHHLDGFTHFDHVKGDLSPLIWYE